jgi:hypothetical protein
MVSRYSEGCERRCATRAMSRLSRHADRSGSLSCASAARRSDLARSMSSGDHGRGLERDWAIEW